MKSRKTTFSMMVRALCALALILVAFGHRPITLIGPDQSTFDLSQYVLPDGTLPVLCATDKDGSGPTHHYGTLVCDACLIGSAFLLPCPADIVGERLAFVSQAFGLNRVEAFYRQLFPPNTSPRGPPSLVLIA